MCYCLPSSFSEPFDPKTYPSIQIRERVYGQHFHGDMIPKREVQIDSSHTIRARENVFIRAGLERYFDDAFGWATFLNVAKVSYFVGAGMAKGRVGTIGSSSGFPLLFLVLGQFFDVASFVCDVHMRECVTRFEIVFIIHRLLSLGYWT